MLSALKVCSREGVCVRECVCVYICIQTQASVCVCVRVRVQMYAYAGYVRAQNAEMATAVQQAAETLYKQEKNVQDTMRGLNCELPLWHKFSKVDKSIL